MIEPYNLEMNSNYESNVRRYDGKNFFFHNHFLTTWIFVNFSNLAYSEAKIKSEKTIKFGVKNFYNIVC